MEAWVQVNHHKIFGDLCHIEYIPLSYKIQWRGMHSKIIEGWSICVVYGDVYVRHRVTSKYDPLTKVRDVLDKSIGIICGG